MNQAKRKFCLNHSYNTEIKKLCHSLTMDQTTLSVISIERLSNEFFYEIFDYLNGCDIRRAFSNLNHRFQQLLDCSSLLFKFNFDHSKSEEKFLDSCQQITHINRSQILSIHWWMSLNFNRFFSLFPIDSSLNHLQSLVLYEPSPNTLMSILTNLIHLPRLFSLTIYMLNVLLDLTDIYQIVLALPMLKYYKFSVICADLPLSLPLATPKQFNSIEYLVIDHECTSNQFSIITSYTPKLHHLYFRQINNDDLNIGILLPNTLTNLTHLSIHEYQENFDDFEIFINKIHSNLTMLSFTTCCEDITYLNAVRWEELILNDLPHLQNFYFRYDLCPLNKNTLQRHLGRSAQFTSSFWIDRKWVFEAEVDYENIMYSVRPYRKRWYECDAQHTVMNSFAEYSKFSQLMLTFFPLDEGFEFFNVIIKHILTVGNIFHVEMIEKQIPIDVLMHITDSLSELDSIKIYSLSLNQPEDGSFCSKGKINKITKVYIESMVDMEEVYLLMAFCPYMAYLEVNSMINNNVELYVRNILKKANYEHNDHFRSLCIGVPAADDKMVKKLERMINVEQLVLNFTVKRVLNNIYLQWK